MIKESGATMDNVSEKTRETGIFLGLQTSSFTQEQVPLRFPGTPGSDPLDDAVHCCRAEIRLMPCLLPPESFPVASVSSWSFFSTSCFN